MKEIPTGVEEFPGAVHPRAVECAGIGATGGQVHHRQRLPAAHGQPPGSVAIEHRTHETGLPKTRSIQRIRYSITFFFLHFNN